MEQKNKKGNSSRKVLFSFLPATGYLPDKEMQDEQNELARKREGILHETKDLEKDGTKKTIFIIEDLETGCIHEIDTDCVQFID